MTEVSTRELLQELTESPIKTAGRANKIFLPSGKRAPDLIATKALKECQFDIEDAVEAAGGQRGTAAHH
jgi:hypothetical protein